MPGIRASSGSKSVGLFLILILIVALLASRNSQALMRFLVGQELNMTTAAFSQISTEHYVIKYTTIDKDSVPMVAEAAEDAYQKVSRVVGVKPVQKITVVIYPDDHSLSRSFGWDKDEQAMGVYWAGSIRVLSPRVWLEGSNQQERFEREGPMAHELTHLMVDELTRGNYNRWWTEGMAQYVEKQVNGFEFADPFAGGQEVRYYSLSALDKNFDGLDQQIAYWEALQAVEYIVDQYGNDSLYRIMENLSRGDNLDTAIENSIPVQYSEWEQGFYHYLERC